MWGPSYEHAYIETNIEEAICWKAQRALMWIAVGGTNGSDIKKIYDPERVEQKMCDGVFEIETRTADMSRRNSCIRQSCSFQTKHK